MSARRFKPKAYLKEGCPFSFKFFLFIVEAGLGDTIEMIRCDPESPKFESIKAKLAAGLSKPATFPTVEVEPGCYQADSDALIRRFAKQHEVKMKGLPAFAFYKETIFPQLEELH